MNLYKKYLHGIAEFQKVSENNTSSNWLVSVIPSEDKEKLVKRLYEAGVETRPFFQPISSMPFYEKSENSISYYLGEKGICLPSYPSLNEDDIKFICKLIIES